MAESRETETAQHRRARLEENRMRIAETRQAVMRLNFNLEAFNYDDFSISFIFYRIPSNAGDIGAVSRG
jgi:hypothetical protein